MINREADPAILRFLDERIIQGQQPDESSRHKFVRVAVTASSVSLIVIGQTAFLNVSRSLAGDHKVIGWALALDNCAAWGVVDAWAMGSMGNEIIRPISSEEKSILNSKSSRLVDLMLRVTSFGVACFSVVPHVYMGYFYNNNSIGFALLAAFTDIWIPAHSLNLTFKSQQQKYLKTEYEKHLLASKKNLLRLIQENRNCLLDKDDRVIEAYVANFNGLKELDSTQEKASNLIELITRNPIKELEEPGKLRKYSKRVAQGGGIILSGTAILMNAAIGYNFADYLMDGIVENFVSEAVLNESSAYLVTNFLVSASAGGFVGGSSAYLLTKLIMESTEGFFEIGANLLKGKLPQSWGARYRPKLTYALKLSALLVSVFSFAPQVELANDNFDGYLEDYMKIANPIAFDVAIGFLLLNLVDDLMEKHLAFFGKEDEKALMKINHRIDHLSRVVQSSSLIEYAKFCKLVPDDVRDRWEEKAEFTQSNLESYIAQNTPQEEEEQLSLLV